MARGPVLPKTEPLQFAKIFFSLAVSTVFILLLCSAFEPRWETNDDIAMSMVAHGYGIAAFGSPNIVFSNVVWGYLVRALPEIHGMLGYSIATLVSLFTIGVVVTYGLCHLGLGILGAVATLTLVLARPILFPQFTLNAGLFMVAAIIIWHLYAQNERRGYLVLAAILAFLSVLVRVQEAIIVLLVAVPLLPWALLKSRPVQVSVISLAGLVVLAITLDHWAYTEKSWSAYNEFNLVRAAFTDFGAIERLPFTQHILAKYDYTMNDLRLIEAWFFADPKIADAGRLTSMLQEFPLNTLAKNSFATALTSIEILFHPYLKQVIFAALFSLAIFPSWRVSVSWILFIASILAIALLGRPAIMRVYFPVACMLVIAPFLNAKLQDGWAFVWRQRLVVGLLIPLAGFNAEIVMTESKRTQTETHLLREVMENYPSSLVVAWGAVLPFEAIYPVIGLNASAMSYRLYALGAFTLAPFSVASLEEKAGTGFLSRLTTDEGISITATDKETRLLATYCRERLGSSLVELGGAPRKATMVRQVRCQP